jgi:hypothetical protein
MSSIPAKGPAASPFESQALLLTSGIRRMGSFAVERFRGSEFVEALAVAC